MNSSDLTRRRFLSGFLALAATVATTMPAVAQSLNEARSTGYIGERPDGYLAQRDASAPQWALDLMSDINQQRRAKYSELAASNGTSLEAVEVVAGEKIIESLPAGSYYMDASGNWMQK